MSLRTFSFPLLKTFPVRASGTVLALFLTLFSAIFASFPAQAENLGLSVRYGVDGGDFEGAGIALRFGPWWSRDLGNWKATLNPEVEATHFRYTGSGPGPGSMNQLGGMGIFRIQLGEGRFRPYAEAGLGLALFSRSSLGDKEFSTRYQFSEHIGAGVQFAGNWFAGWRFSHYSNADIKEPNSGIDLNQLVVGAHF